MDLDSDFILTEKKNLKKISPEGRVTSYNWLKKGSYRAVLVATTLRFWVSEPLTITDHGLTAGKLYLVYNRKAVQLFPLSGKTPGSSALALLKKRQQKPQGWGQMRGTSSSI